MSATIPAAAESGLRGLARRHPVGLFLALVFGVSYPLMALCVLAARGVIPGGGVFGAIGLDAERGTALAMVWLALFPAALVVTALAGGRTAVQAFLGRMVRWRIGAGWWAVALAALPTLTVVISVLLGDRFRPPTLTALGSELGGALAGFLAVNLWEESSWAGFMQTRLAERGGLLRAAAITAVPFAAIHLPLQFLDHTPSVGGLLSSFALLAVLAVVVRAYFGLVLDGTGGSLLAVGAAHTIFNRSNNSDGIAALLLEGGHRQIGALLATAVLAVVLGILRRRRATR